ncbi:hypothetical protein D3C76_1577170 [compost metagenome]
MGEGRLDGVHVKAPMFGELLVFAGNDGDLEFIGDLIPGPPASLQVDWLAVKPGLHLAFEHQGCARRWDPAKNQHQQDATRCKPEQGFCEQA